MSVKQNRKLNKKGFTLAETLMAVIILLLVSTIVATGIPVAKNAYDKVIVGANAEVVLSTAITTLRDELGKATGTIETPNDSEGNTWITYTSPNSGVKSKICLDDGAIKYIKIVTNPDADADPDNSRPLVSEAASTSALYVTYDTIAYSNGIVTITNLKVNRTTGDKKTLASLDVLEIRVISGGS